MVRLREMKFRGVAVGLVIEAESAEERELLRALEGLKAEGNERAKGERPQVLFLEPRVPWANDREPAQNASSEPA